jgi:group I intron endonuclease
VFVYLIYCRSTSKGYVGQTTTTIEERWRLHCNTARTGSLYLIHKAIRKYGAKNFEISILAESDNLPDLSRIEVEQIKLQGTKIPNGYNLTDGGEGWRHTHSAETKAKISAAKKGKISGPRHRITPENRMKMIAGQRNSVYHHSEERKAKISKSALGRHKTEDHRKHLSISKKGKPWTDARRAAQDSHYVN